LALPISSGAFLHVVGQSFQRGHRPGMAEEPTPHPGLAFSAVAGAILLHAFDPLTAIPVMMACSIASRR
jgi:hypothetical protein